MNDLLEQNLDHYVPFRSDLRPNWADVLERAELVEAPVRRRLWVTAALSATVFVLAAAAAAVVVALWPGGEGGVLDRALAAVGPRPIIHVVFREEVDETLVDLETGMRTPLYVHVVADSEEAVIAVARALEPWR